MVEATRVPYDGIATKTHLCRVVCDARRVAHLHGHVGAAHGEAAAGAAEVLHATGGERVCARCAAALDGAGGRVTRRALVLGG